MDGHRDIYVSRLLEIDAVTAAAAVLGLRREFSGLTQTWSLGERGTFEVDAQFVGMTLTEPSLFGQQSITTTGRLWSADGLSVTSVEITLQSTLRPPSELALSSSAELPPAFRDCIGDYLELAQAAVNELAEELLFHAQTAARSRNRG